MYIDLVKEFMLTAGQEVKNNPETLSKKTGKLRLSLILEELEELSVALGLNAEFKKMMYIRANKEVQFETTNLIEQMDAYCDLQYVLSGAILASGMQDSFDRNFKAVHESNMSKFCIDLDEVRDTINYLDIRESVYTKMIGKYYIIYRKSDNKVLKSINYKPVKIEL